MRLFVVYDTVYAEICNLFCFLNKATVYFNLDVRVLVIFVSFITDIHTN